MQNAKFRMEMQNALTGGQLAVLRFNA